MSVGLDLLDIARLEQALARRPGLADRLFSPAELAYAASRPRPGQHLAARFCAKEAVTKALGLEVFAPRTIDVAGGGSAGVRVVLHGPAAARAETLGVRVDVSLTHTGDTAGAVALTAPLDAGRR